MSTRKVLEAGISRHQHPEGEIRRTERGVPSKEQLALPFYNLLPTNHLDLIRWRIYVRRRCLEDLEFRALIDECCSLDPCFFAATFAWVFEPRPPRGIPIQPFCDQADVLCWFKECFETERDGGLEKSRGIFGTWTVMMFAYWVWAYVPESKVAYITKDEATMDGPDENSALGKFVYIHNKMPEWFKVNRYGGLKLRELKQEHVKINTDNGAALQGFPPTNNNVRSLRFTLLINDEFAFFPRNAQKALFASAGTAPCRLFISTFQGRDDEFHHIMRVEKSTMLRMEAYWWNNAPRWKGAYTAENGRLKLIDPDFNWRKEYPEGYRFILDGMLRSPWVDYELSRPGNVNRPGAIEEYYGLVAGNQRKLFRNDLTPLVGSMVRQPDRVGEIVIRNGKAEFVPQHGGRVRIWGTPEESGPFVAGCDLGMGMGATFSTLELIDLKSGEQTLELCDNTMQEAEFAEYAYNLLQWVNGDRGDGHTFLDFENNGKQGTVFATQIDRLGYGCVQIRRLKQVVRKAGQADRTTYMGTKNQDKGMSNFAEMERAIFAGELIVRSEAVMLEIDGADVDLEKKPIFQAVDGSHGDRLQGLALAWQSGKDRLEIDNSTAPTTPEQARSEISGLFNAPMESQWRTAKALHR
jgi:hypothetical protein